MTGNGELALILKTLTGWIFQSGKARIFWAEF
jgi:hypothetical protein